MSLPAFDTHKAVKHLTKAGANEPLAEAVVTTISTAMNEHMATKADLKSLEGNLNGRIDGLEESLNGRIDGLEQSLNARMDGIEERQKAQLESLEQRLTIRLGGMIVIGVAVLATLDKLL